MALGVRQLGDMSDYGRLHFHQGQGQGIKHLKHPLVAVLLAWISHNPSSRSRELQVGVLKLGTIINAFILRWAISVLSSLKLSSLSLFSDFTQVGEFHLPI